MFQSLNHWATVFSALQSYYCLGPSVKSLKLNGGCSFHPSLVEDPKALPSWVAFVFKRWIETGCGSAESHAQTLSLWYK